MEQWAKGTQTVKSALWQLYLRLLGDIRPHYRAPAAMPNSSSRSTAVTVSARDIFQYEHYLENQPSANVAFMREFVQTQNFLTFVEKAFKTPADCRDVQDFMHAMRLFKEASATAPISSSLPDCGPLMNSFHNVRKSITSTSLASTNFP
jgi:hypothetical protein